MQKSAPHFGIIFLKASGIVIGLMLLSFAGMSIYQTLQQTFATSPTWTQFTQTIRIFFAFLIGAISILTPLGLGRYAYTKRHRYGKDAPERSVIHFSIPSYLTPPKLATFLTKSNSNSVFFALLYHRYQQRRITIDFSSTHFSIAKTNKNPELSPEENQFRSFLFNNNDHFQIHNPQSALPLQSAFESLNSALLIEMEQQRYDSSSLQARKKLLIPIGIILGLLRLFLEIDPNIFDRNTDLELWKILLFGGITTSCIILVMFVILMPKRTQQGHFLYEQIKGYQHYLRRVEFPRLQQLIKDDPEAQDPLLPIAIALGMNTPWTEKMKKFIPITPTDYYLKGKFFKHL